MNGTNGQSRRTVLGGMAAGAGLMAMATETNAQSPSPTPTTSLAKTFVLVHGAWHGGWCWRRVADRLEGKGHKVFVPTMTGLGEQVRTLPQAGECRREHLVALGGEQVGDPPPAPSAMPGAMNQDEGVGHVCALFDRL